MGCLPQLGMLIFFVDEQCSVMHCTLQLYGVLDHELCKSGFGGLLA